MAPEERRRAILDAAVRVFARKGFHACRVGDIATEAGVSHGLLYHYFGSKDEVLDTVIAESWGRFVGALREVERGSAPPEEKLELVIAIMLRTWRREPDAVRVLVREVGRGPRLESRVGELQAAFDVLRGIVEEGQASGAFRGDVGAEQASWVVYGAIEEILTGWAMGTLRGEADDVARAEKTVRTIVAGGLAPRTPASV